MISFLLLTMNIYLPLDIFHNMRRFARFGTIWSILKNMKNTNRGLLLLVQLQSEACNFTKSNTPSWVFFPFFKIVQMVANRAKHHIFSQDSFLSNPLPHHYWQPRFHEASSQSQTNFHAVFFHILAAPSRIFAYARQ